MLRVASDENFDARIVQGLKARLPGLDLVSVEQAGLRAATDPEVLDWAANEGRALLTHDERTMPRFVYARVDAGRPTSGVVLVPDRLAIGRAVADLWLLIQALEPGEMSRRVVVRLPL